MSRSSLLVVDRRIIESETVQMCVYGLLKAACQDARSRRLVMMRRRQCFRLLGIGRWTTRRFASPPTLLVVCSRCDQHPADQVLIKCWTKARQFEPSNCKPHCPTTIDQQAITFRGAVPRRVARSPPIDSCISLRLPIILSTLVYIQRLVDFAFDGGVRIRRLGCFLPVLLDPCSALCRLGLVNHPLLKVSRFAWVARHSFAELDDVNNCSPMLTGMFFSLAYHLVDCFATFGLIVDSAG